ncbi:MAG: tRNA pseudouridine(38-40) synthase TruA [Pseudarcicella sp.]|nr:tRNA pseudouridine(38-40) synthase TruA [Pseudarcicella sp.]MBP6409818.1 tRNA pseudouridine(38-40) synthase TruA [Pseudarcicella sp.]
MRYFISFSYKGTAYNGWQIQENAVTVQQVIQEAMSKILKNPIALTGSSRTDAFVHAKHQIAHFESETEIAQTKNIVYRLNSLLPKDITIFDIWLVADNYHCRFEAIFRRYEYHISRCKNPFATDLSYHFEIDLDLNKMNLACEILLKHTDFEAFSKVKTEVYTFDCTITKAIWEYKNKDLLVFTIQANRFLRGMVRTIVGTLLDVGTGKLNVEDFEKIIISKSRKKAGRSVPAHGLYLMEVGY